MAKNSDTEKDISSEKFQRELVAKRYGVDASCKNCRHAFPVRLPAQIVTQLECRRSPPHYQLLVVGINPGSGAPTYQPQHVPRIVTDNFVCGSFQMLPKEVKLT